MRANHNYALNIQLVMAMQEIGGCGTEADVVLSFLNLAHGATMKAVTFHKTEDKLGFVIR